MKPMKAYGKTPPLTELSYPLLASTKLDGIRCVIKDGVALSNSLKPIPNLSVQRWAKEHAAVLEGLDGELMVHGDFNDVQSVIMSVHGGNKWTFCYFDVWDRPSLPFSGRYSALAGSAATRSEVVPQIRLVEQEVIHTPDGLQAFWDKAVEDGHEGVIARCPKGPYKYGRSTLKQGWMIKLKGWSDDEAEITGYYELMRNENEAFEGELGQTKRSREQAGLVPAGTLGGLTVKWNGVTFNIGGGPGLTAEERQRLWDKRETLKGLFCTFKYFGLSKAGVPRHPNWKGIRYDV